MGSPHLPVWAVHTTVHSSRDHTKRGDQIQESLHPLVKSSRSDVALVGQTCLLHKLFFSRRNDSFTLGWGALAHQRSQETLCFSSLHAALWMGQAEIHDILLPKTGQWESCHSQDIYNCTACRIAAPLPNRPHGNKGTLALGLKVSVVRQCERCRHNPPELQT